MKGFRCLTHDPTTVTMYLFGGYITTLPGPHSKNMPILPRVPVAHHDRLLSVGRPLAAEPARERLLLPTRDANGR